MKVLFIGDIVGNVGRQMIEDYLYRVRKDYQIDFVIANVENATHGKGLNRKHYDFFTFEGVDCMTMGNHTFDKKELFDFIDEADRLVVPYNQPRVLPGGRPGEIRSAGGEFHAVYDIDESLVPRKSPVKPFSGL